MKENQSLNDNEAHKNTSKLYNNYNQDVEIKYKNEQKPYQKIMTEKSKEGLKKSMENFTKSYKKKYRKLKTIQKLNEELSKKLTKDGNNVKCYKIFDDKNIDFLQFMHHNDLFEIIWRACNYFYSFFFCICM